MKVYMTKGQAGTLHAADIEAEEFLMSIGLGDVVSCEIKRPRNIGFHKKLFALVNHAFEHWEPPEAEFRGLTVQKNFEFFRNNLTCAAGYFTPVVTLNGDIRSIPDSWSFGSMSEEKFSKMYSAIADVILQSVLKNYTRDDLDKVVSEILRFA